MVRPLSAPLKVSLDVTGRCNLNCSHCRAQGEAGSRAELDFGTVAAVIDDAASMGVFRLGLAGGEPFLREDLEEIIQHAISRGIPRVFVSTNGTLTTAKRLGKLAGCRERITFKVSVDGPAEIHDQIRGAPGSLDGAISGIALMRGFGFDVQVTTTLSKANLGHLEETLRQVERTGCSKQYVVEVVPKGRANLTMLLTPEDRQKALAALASFRSSGSCRPNKVVAKIGFADASPGFECCAGVSECGVLSDGRVVGCRLLPEIAEESVLQRPLSATWRSATAFAYYRSQLPGRLGNPCRTCSLLATCRGGCRAFAAWRLADEEGPDVRCHKFAGSTCRRAERTSDP